MTPPLWLYVCALFGGPLLAITITVGAIAWCALTAHPETDR